MEPGSVSGGRLAAQEGIILKALALVPILILLFIRLQPSLDIKEISISGPSIETQHPEEMPWKGTLKRGALVTADLHLMYAPRFGKQLRIIPVSCLTRANINGKVIDTVFMPESQRCDWARGIVFDEAPGFQAGENRVGFTIERQGGEAVIDVRECVHPLILIPLLALSAVGVISIILRRAGFAWPPTLIIGCGVALRFLYLLHTPAHLRTYDVFMGGGHLDYIRHIMEHASLPTFGAGWEYHQPPLYYLLAAGVLWIADAVGIHQLFALQLFSLALNLLFLVVGAAIVRVTVSRASIQLVVIGLLSIWPSSIIDSIRIGNDSLIVPLVSLALLYLMRWTTDHRPRDIQLASVFSIAAFVTKASGIIALILVGGAILKSFYLARKEGQTRATEGAKLAAAILVGGSLFACLVRVYISHLAGADWLMGTAGSRLSPSLSVANSIGNFLGFDFPALFRSPFADSFEDYSGRRYFWTYLMKTALFEDMEFKSRWLAGLGWVLLSSWALFILATVVSLFGNISRLRGAQAVQICCISLSVGALIAFRIRDPFACHGNFRLIAFTLPFVLSLGGLAWSSTAINIFTRSSRAMIMTAALLFIPAAVAFFILLATIEIAAA